MRRSKRACERERAHRRRVLRENRIVFSFSSVPRRPTCSQSRDEAVRPSILFDNFDNPRDAGRALPWLSHVR